jgi:2,4-diaminopentanoate dehydrogenase
MTAPLRVVQWATGNIGSRSLRAVIDHPDLELVGVYVHTPEKAGKEIGGVVTTNDVDEIVALRADCVLYMPRACDVDVVCRLLESGADVVTTRGEFHRPASMPADVRARVEAACAAGGTSIHSTGSSPGFITEAVPLVLTSIQRRLDRLVIEESADMSPRNSPGLLFDVMGFGRPPEKISDARLQHGLHSFGPSLHLVADALSIAIDGIEADGAVATATKTVAIAAGTLEAGTVAAQRTTVSALRGGEPVLQFLATWYVTADLDPAWEVHRTGWRITVEGDAPLVVDMPFPFDLEEMAERSPGYTAHRAVNAVPYVCAAPPGIRTSVDLPQIIARL